MNIVTDFKNSGKQRLVLVRSQCGTPLRNEGLLPYTRGYDAAAQLAETYPNIGRQSYPGFLECIEASEHCLADCSGSVFDKAPEVSRRDP